MGRLELVLVSGERRTLTAPAHTGTVGSFLDRLDAWIETDDGGWVQKAHVVEVVVAEAPSSTDRRSAAGELRQLDDAVSDMMSGHE